MKCITPRHEVGSWHTMFNARSYLIVACSLFVCQSAQGQTSEQSQAEIYIGKMHDSRTGIKLAQLRWTLRIVLYKKHPELNGAAYEYHSWHDFGHDRVRVESVSTVPSNAALTNKSRFAFANDKYLVVDTEHTGGWELDGRGHQYMRDPRSLTVFDLSADPRVIGILPTEFMFLKNYGVEDILKLFHTSRSSEVSDDRVDGRLLKKLSFDGYAGAKCALTYWLDSEAGDMPVRIVSNATRPHGSLRLDVQSVWKYFKNKDGSEDGAWLPVETISRRWENDDLTIHEQFTLHDAVLGMRPSDELFHWKGMMLPDKFVVEHTSGKTKHMKQWNANTQSFEPWKPRPLVYDTASATWTVSTQLLLFGSVFGAVVCAVYLTIRWLRK